MNPSDSVKNISTKDVISLEQLFSSKLSLNTVNLELFIDPYICPLLHRSLIRLDKQKYLLNKFVYKTQRNLTQRNLTQKNLLTVKDSIIECASKYELFLDKRLTNNSVQKQKNLRLKSQKKLDKERRAKRKPSNLFN
jgi:hypothetical protein